MRSSDALLTVIQAAERLNVSRVTVYNLMRSGQLGSMRIGRARRVPESAITAFIADRTTCGLSGDAA